MQESTCHSEGAERLKNLAKTLRFAQNDILDIKILECILEVLHGRNMAR